MAEHALIVDDEPNMRWVLKEALDGAGYVVHLAANGREALALMGDVAPDVVLLDLKMKEMDGLSTLQRIRERFPDVVVIMLTAYGTVATAVQAMQLGAADFLRKPFDVEEVLFKLQRALERRRLHHELHALRAREHQMRATTTCIGTHPRWRTALDQATTPRQGSGDLWLWGPDGSGRATLARASHAASARCRAPLVEIDLRSVPAAAQSTLLVGDQGYEGAWQQAGHGSLLLRNGASLHADAWTQLAALLAARPTNTPQPCVLITAHQPAAEALQGGPPFAEIAVPALHEHGDDIALFVHAWLPGQKLAPQVLQRLQRYTWPANVAELRGVLERALVLADGGVIEEQHLPPALYNLRTGAALIELPPDGLDIEQVEQTLIRQALQRAQGNKRRAAALLGLTRHTLLYRMEKYGILAGGTDEQP